MLSVAYMHLPSDDVRHSPDAGSNVNYCLFVVMRSVVYVK